MYVSVRETENGLKEASGYRRSAIMKRRGVCLSLRIGSIGDLFERLWCRYEWRSFGWSSVGRMRWRRAVDMGPVIKD